VKEAIVLALECSQRSASLALFAHGEIQTIQMESEQSQSSLLLPLVQDFLKSCNLKPEQVTDLGIHIGPGGSTGLRMGIAFAQAWNMVYPVRCHGIPLEYLALEVLNSSSQPHSKAMLLSDAFGGQFFSASYSKLVSGWIIEKDLELCELEDITLSVDMPLVVIEDLGRTKEKLKWPEIWHWSTDRFPDAIQVLNMTLKAQFVMPIQTMDVRYLKASSAEINWDKRKTLGAGIC
jgi:tRNA threonylcarbamoyl adenosine modification protein YeaZ